MKRILIISCMIITGLAAGCAFKETDHSVHVNFQIFDSYHQIHILANGEQFASLLYDSALLKPVLFPIYSPSHIQVLRQFPLNIIEGESRDHPHHAGLFFTYGSAGEVNGNSFWADQQPPTQIRQIKIIREEVNTNEAIIETLSNWIGRDGNVVLVENRTMVFTGTESERAIDFTFILKAQNQNVVFKDTKEGMFGMRVADWLTEDAGNSKYLSSEGDSTEGNIWGKRSKWVRLEGHRDGKVIGIIIFNHPTSTNYPTYWHARAYGLFAANPLGRSVFEEGRGIKNPEPMNFTITAGDSALFKFKMIVYEGHRTPVGIEKEFEEYRK